MYLLSKFKKVFSTSENHESTKAIDTLITNIYVETEADNDYYYGQLKLTNSTTYQELRAKKPEKKVELLFEVLNYFIKKRQTHNGNIYYHKDVSRRKLAVADTIIQLLLRQKLVFTETQLQQLINTFLHPVKSNFYVQYPIGLAFKQVEKYVSKHGLNDSLKQFLIKLKNHKTLQKDYTYGPDYKKLRLKIDHLLQAQSGEKVVPIFALSNDDAWGVAVNKSVHPLPEVQRNEWYQLFHLAVMVNGGKPTKKYLKTAKVHVDALGKNFKPLIWQWLENFVFLKEVKETHTYRWGTRTHEYDSYTFIDSKNSNLLKGLVWSLVQFHDKKTLDLLARVTERAFKKIPSVGPAAAAVGNAAIYVLAQSKGLVGVSHLSRLKLKVQQSNTRRLIEKYVTEQSEKLGVSAAEIEDIAVPDYGLVDGKKVWTFGDYQFVVKIAGIGKIATTWIKPDGKIQKSVPAFVKQAKKYRDRLKAAKAEVKLIQKYLTAQRDRIYRNYIQNRRWTYEDFKNYYLDHGLMGFITKRLIWNLHDDENTTPAFYSESEWRTIDNRAIETTDKTFVTLWHPVDATTDEVLAWRDQLETWQIRQPFKQAYREVYILTDAEVNTRLYSNRMAAHILKQHQFNALAGLRGWKYSLMGAYDDGRYDETAQIKIPAYGLTAEFWIGELNEDDAFNDAGIWNYVTTDQVRFKNENDTVNLIDVPKLVFSEIMRDVDMFVGVASVGNDPQWQDNGGLRQHHDYWQAYSFGNLSEMAKTRKAVLEKLIPRLKIRDKATIDGKFLRVEGKRRTYKIHIGSTNILMEPNDQYLCIVPSRKKDSKTEGIFLPFEGDRGLSVVLSKAFMLAEDDKITDSTITSQIGRR
ncbi:MAG: DUF4132 domain-containing protein [Bacteroidota bacterium]